MKSVTIHVATRELRCDQVCLQAIEPGVAVQAAFDGDVGYVPAGTAAVVCFLPEEGGHALTVEGQVLGQMRLGARSNITVGFDDAHRRKIEKAMNARVSLRVATDPCNPVTAILQNGAEARVVDLSAEGCLLELPRTETLTLDGWEVRLEVRIPGESSSIALTGEIRKHDRTGTTIRLGVQFDAPAGEAGAAARERVDRFVVARRVELLRAEARDRVA